MRNVGTTLKVSILFLMAVCLMISSCKKDEGGNGGSGTTPTETKVEGGSKMAQKGSGGSWFDGKLEDFGHTGSNFFGAAPVVGLTDTITKPTARLGLTYGG